LPPGGTMCSRRRTRQVWQQRPQHHAMARRVLHVMTSFSCNILCIVTNSQNNIPFA
jgi:hypothetical protein